MFRRGVVVNIRKAFVALLLVAWASHHAAAEPIRIVAGALVFERVSPSTFSSVNLVGDSEGFTFAGHLYSGFLGPYNQCVVPECFAGTSVSLHASIAPAAGPATFRGQSFPINPIVPPGAGAIEGVFDGTFLIPQGFTGGVLIAPFSFAGGFYYPGPPNNSVYKGPPLVGHGTATVTLSLGNGTDFPDAFMVERFRYDFTPAEPVPEPASMLLIGSGFGCLVALRRRRNSRRS
jgi:hypothetical protein